MARLLLFFFALVAHFQLSIQQECSVSKPCELGCCSRSGFCGFGPDHCGDGCLSGCDRKADCNPGTWNSTKWSKWEKCPLNVCCSKSGFCGTTEEFCAGKPVKRPSCNINNTPVERVIGYYEAWSTSKRRCYSMLPESIPYGYYTDIIFSFATIDPQTFEIEAGDHKTEEYMRRISTIKLVQPDIRIWIAVGGWSFNDPGPTRTTFSDIAGSAANRQKFLNSLVLFMNKYGFDGIDIDWEYPVAEDRGGRGVDYENFVSFMRALNLRMKWFRRRFVSLTLPASYWYLQHFDIVGLEPLVDWFNIMTYDMHGSWDLTNKWTGPFANSHTNMTEIQDALDLLWRNDISPRKVTFGMAFYSRSFTLQDPACNEPGCRVSSGGNAGRCSGTTGVLLHPEIADEIRTRGLTPTLYRGAAVKTVSWGDQWVSFDDVVTWRLKANIIRSQCIPGVMVWAMSQDDEEGTNIKALTAALDRKQMPEPNFSKPNNTQPVADLAPPRLCRWSGCYADCPPGFKTVQRFGHEEVMLTEENCMDQGMSRLCCPADQPLPSCGWNGHSNSGKCTPGCAPGEVEVGTLTYGCSSGYQSACCTNTTSTAAYGVCKWTGCGESCPSALPHKVVSAWMGSGGMPHCDVDKLRSFCCPDPPPADFTDCSWVSVNGSHYNSKYYCEDTCPSDQVKIATETAGGFTGFGNGCFVGARGYCCKQPPPPVVPRDDDNEDPFGGKQNKEFQGLLEEYMENPTCPATILVPERSSWFRDSKRRSLSAETAELGILQSRATECKEDHFTRLVAFGAAMLTMSTSMLEPLRVVYDELFADHFDSELRADSLRSYYESIPNLDPNGLMQYVFLNPVQAGRGIWRDRQTTSAFCQVESTSTTRKRQGLDASGQSSALLAPRIVEWLPSSAGVPDFGTVVQGILNGELSLHYARWVYLRNQGGPMLELAYWIGPVPGQPGGSDRYRDNTRPTNGRPDRWVVVHLHINERTNWLRSFNGRTYVGIQSVQIFHGQETNEIEGQGAWRVDNTGSRSTRRGYRCPENTLWYFGAPVAIPGSSPADEAMRQYWQNLRDWALRLFNSGYVASPGLSLILRNPVRLINGDYDPSSRTLLGQGENHPDYHQNMWLINWIITGLNPLFFDFGPADPDA
ncbi:glycosylhydrolase family 18-9 [Achaetomium macrosporum]|uniref:chitinase n=1 Tax=Achaetomium macrosporum TaxID=79813 RepID=A0AAN7C0X6_9PEZI|nr:glycosylhydrolase family 18-9 [Achaetomium macrosporum]